MSNTTPDQAPWYLANFDSSSGLVKALANTLQGQGFEVKDRLRPEQE
jgi:hypothetical protein